MKSHPQIHLRIVLATFISLCFVVACYAQNKNQKDDDVIRIDTELAVFEVLVLDEKQRYVSGLTMDDFMVKEDGKKQTLSGFALGDGSTVPRSIILIIDHSGSQQPYLKNSVDAAKILVDKLKPQDRLALVTDDVKVLVEFTSNKSTLKITLEGLLEYGNVGKSQQYTALLATLNDLVKKEVRPIIIFQTDGDELGALMNGRRKEALKFTPPSKDDLPKDYSIDDLFNAAERSRVTIYSIIPGVRFIGFSEEEQRARAKLEFEKMIQTNQRATPPNSVKLDDRFFSNRARIFLEWQLALANLAKITGGWADYLEEPGQAEAVYNRIFTGIEKRYILSYYPTNEARDGKLRKVEIKIRNHDKYTVWGRNSYYVSKK